MASVFISYSRKDTEFAKKLVHFLEEKDHRIWMDKKRILGGANYVKEIADGIGKADIFFRGEWRSPVRISISAPEAAPEGEIR